MQEKTVNFKSGGYANAVNYIYYNIAEALNLTNITMKDILIIAPAYTRWIFEKANIVNEKPSNYDRNAKVEYFGSFSPHGSWEPLDVYLDLTHKLLAAGVILVAFKNKIDQPFMKFNIIG